MWKFYNRVAPKRPNDGKPSDKTSDAMSEPINCLTLTKLLPVNPGIDSILICQS